MDVRMNARMQSLYEGYRVKMGAAKGSIDQDAPAAPGGQQEGGSSAVATEAATPVSGASGSSLLAPATLGQAVAQGQEADDAAIPTGVSNRLKDIAENSSVAAQEARSFAYGTRSVCMQPPPNGSPASVWQQFSQKMAAANDAINQIQSQKVDLYQNETAKGTAPAQIYADMLKLELSQPQSYWSAQDPNHQLGDLRGNVQAQLTQLERNMASSAQG